MHPIAGTYPTCLDSHVQLAFKPGSAVADAPAGAFATARRPAKFDGSQALLIADVAKNEFSYAHVDFVGKRAGNEVESRFE
jgi:hypothetical protein